jgi:hypothetical protein
LVLTVGSEAVQKLPALFWSKNEPVTVPSHLKLP